MLYSLATKAGLAMPVPGRYVSHRVLEPPVCFYYDSLSKRGNEGKAGQSIDGMAIFA